MKSLQHLEVFSSFRRGKSGESGVGLRRTTYKLDFYSCVFVPFVVWTAIVVVCELCIYEKR